MIAIVFAVLLYRLAVAGALYRAVQNVNGGPSGADFVVLLTGSLLQLVGILVMNKVEHYYITICVAWKIIKGRCKCVYLLAPDNFLGCPI